MITILIVSGIILVLSFLGFVYGSFSFNYGLFFGSIAIAICDVLITTGLILGKIFL